MPDSVFHGSYLAADVEFLLKPIDMPFTRVEQKERLIQSGAAHYSEMLSPEYIPSPEYLAVFHRAFARNRRQLAGHAFCLAAHLAQRKRVPVLVSLARAGTPVGVLLKRILREFFRQETMHYTVSIIRDRGIDENALRHIRRRHGDAGDNLVFVDGWTGKGVIARELHRWINVYNHRHGTRISSDLYVIADICGYAAVAATQEDCLIPSSLLNATISGMISRSILNAAYIGADDFHGCRYYGKTHGEDLSLWYIEELMQDVRAIHGQGSPATACVSGDAMHRRRRQSDAFIQGMMKAYGIGNINLLKPGLGEAIRVLLRRVPERILVRDKSHPEIKPFLVLAEEKQVAVEVRRDMPYLAAGIIAGAG